MQLLSKIITVIQEKQYKIKSSISVDFAVYIDLINKIIYNGHELFRFDFTLKRLFYWRLG